MKFIKKNKLFLLITLFAVILILVVNRVYEERIRQIEEKLPDLHNTSVRKTN